MGYELNKLMNQFGVSSPTLAYSGISKPIQPTALSSSASDAEKSNYDALMAKYNQNQEKYAADKSVYDDYAKQYQTRLMQTPMYGQKQFSTLPTLNQPVQTLQERTPENMVTQAYASIGRGGMGSNANQIDPEGYDYWLNQLKTGQIAPERFNENFQNTVNKYMKEKPDDRYTSYIKGFNNLQSKGTQWDSPLPLPAYPSQQQIQSQPINQVPQIPFVQPSNLAQLANSAGSLSGFNPEIGNEYGYEDPYSYRGKLNNFRFDDSVKTNYADGGFVDNKTDEYGYPANPSPFMDVAEVSTKAVKPPINELVKKYQDIMQLQSMVNSGEMPYQTERKQAKERADQETLAFNNLLQNAISNQPDNAPSKAELYFRLAAAFGSPTKTGHFMENVANAAQVGAQYKQSEREAIQAANARKMQYGLDSQRAKMTLAREDEKDAQQMAIEEMKGRKELANKLAQDYVKTNDPQSSAGKQAIDEGLVPGTPIYQQRVKEIGDMLANKNEAGIQAALGNLQVAQAGLGIRQQELGLKQIEDQRKASQSEKLTPTEMKMKEEAEDNLNSITDSIKILKKAYSLNPNTFDASAIDIVQRKALEFAGSKDKKLLATREQENLLQEKALAGLKSAFGGNPTEGERKIQLDLQGIGAKSKEERARVLENAYELLQAKQARQKARLNQIRSGAFRNTIDSVEE